NWYTLNRMPALTRRHPQGVVLVAPAPSPLTPGPPRSRHGRGKKRRCLGCDRRPARRARGRGIYRSVTFLFEKRSGGWIVAHREARALARMRAAAYVNAADRLDRLVSIKVTL